MQILKIETLTPQEVEKTYLKKDGFNQYKIKDFNIFKIEDLIEQIILPHPPFKNTSHGFIYITNGQVKMILDIEEFVFTSNKFILTPAGQINSFKEFKKGTKGYIGTFDEHFLFDKKSVMLTKEMSELLNPSVFPHFNILKELKILFHSIFERLLYYQERIDNRQDVIKSYLNVLFNELSEIFFNSKKERVKTSKRLFSAFKALVYKENNFQLKASDYAKKLNVSTNHLNKIVQKNSKNSTTQWLSKRRVNEAKILLLNSRLSVSEIAFQTGFVDATYFSAFFKKLTKRSPTDYRKIEKHK